MIKITPIEKEIIKRMIIFKTNNTFNNDKHKGWFSKKEIEENNPPYPKSKAWDYLDNSLVKKKIIEFRIKKYKDNRGRKHQKKEYRILQDWETYGEILKILENKILKNSDYFKLILNDETFKKMIKKHLFEKYLELEIDLYNFQPILSQKDIKNIKLEAKNKFKGHGSLIGGYKGFMDTMEEILIKNCK